MKSLLARISLVLSLLLTISMPAAAGEIPPPYLLMDSIQGDQPWMDITGNRPYQMVAGDNVLYYFQQGTWISNGTPAGTKRVIGSGPCFLFDQMSSEIPKEWAVAVGDILYYSGGDCHLWRTDGTQAGTWRVKYLNSPPVIYGNPSNFARLNNSFVFAAWGYQAAGDPYNLWVSNGTEAGTRLIKQLHADHNMIQITPIRAVGGLGYFFTYGWDTRLWRTDGTPAGTYVIANYSTGWTPDAVVGWNGLAFFIAPRNANTSNEMILWQTNGSASGTQPVDAVYGPEGRAREQFRLIAAKDWLYGLYHDGTDLAIFRTQGKTQGGVTPVDNIEEGGWRPPSAVVIGNQLYFVKDFEIWETDGTSANMRQVVQLEVAGSKPANLIAGAGQLFFSATDSAHGTELWTLDLATREARLLMDIYQGPYSSEPAQLTLMAGRLVFYAFEPDHGQELWATSYLNEKVFLPMVRR